jgi:hypothetical protein
MHTCCSLLELLVELLGGDFAVGHFDSIAQLLVLVLLLGGCSVVSRCWWWLCVQDEDEGGGYGRVRA